MRRETKFSDINHNTKQKLDARKSNNQYYSDKSYVVSDLDRTETLYPGTQGTPYLVLLFPQCLASSQCTELNCFEGYFNVGNISSTSSGIR